MLVCCGRQTAVGSNLSSGCYLLTEGLSKIGSHYYSYAKDAAPSFNFPVVLLQPGEEKKGHSPQNLYDQVQLHEGIMIFFN